MIKFGVAVVRGPLDVVPMTRLKVDEGSSALHVLADATIQLTIPSMICCCQRVWGGVAGGFQIARNIMRVRVVRVRVEKVNKKFPGPNPNKLHRVKSLKCVWVFIKLFSFSFNTMGHYYYLVFICEEPPFSFDLRIVISFWCGGNCPTIFTSRVCGLVRLVRVCGRRREREEREREEKEKERGWPNCFEYKVSVTVTRSQTHFLRKKWKRKTHQSPSNTEKTHKTTFRFWFFLLVGLVFCIGWVGFGLKTLTANTQSSLRGQSLVTYLVYT